MVDNFRHKQAARFSETTSHCSQIPPRLVLVKNGKMNHFRMFCGKPQNVIRITIAENRISEYVRRHVNIQQLFVKGLLFFAVQGRSLGGLSNASMNERLA